jgi:hypothetical protein
MSKRILLATQNHDKFKIVSTLLTNIGFVGYEFDYLGSINLGHIDIEETGTILDRAEQKARYLKSYLGEKNQYRCIIGIDDGVLIKGQMEETVKKLLPAIFSGELLAEGEVIYNCRAFFAISDDGREAGAEVKIPFKYKKTNDPIPPHDRSYPLSHTLTPANSDTFICDMQSGEEQKYYAEQCQPELVGLGKKMGFL